MNSFSIEKRDVYFLVILFFSFTSIYLLVFDAKMHTGGDNFEYLNYAKSIATGHGYSAPYSSAYKPVNWYPPGYSTMLGILMIPFGNNIMFFKMLNGVFLFGSLLLFYFILKKLTSNTLLAFAVNFYLIFNIGLLKFAYIIMSEMPYLFLTMLALFFLIQYDNIVRDTIWKKPLIATVVSVALAYYFRGIGLSLVAAVGVYFLWQKEWKTLLIYSCGVILIHLPYMIRNAIHGLNGRYMKALLQINPWRPELDQVDSYQSFFEKISMNLVNAIIMVYPKMILPIPHLRYLDPGLMPVLGVLFVVISITGVCLIKKQYRSLVLSFYLFNLLIVLLYHSGNDFRYLVTLIPFMVFGFFNAINELFNKIRKRQHALAVALIVGGVLMVPRMYEFHIMSKRDHSDKFKSFIEVSEYIKSMGYSNITIATRKPGIMHYHSGAYVHRYKFSKNADEVMVDLVKNHVDFIFFDALGYGSNYHYLYPALEKYKAHLRVVKMVDKPRAVLFQFNRMKVKEILEREKLL